MAAAAVELPTHELGWPKALVLDGALLQDIEQLRPALFLRRAAWADAALQSVNDARCHLRRGHVPPNSGLLLSRWIRALSRRSPAATIAFDMAHPLASGIVLAVSKPCKSRN